MKKFAEEQKKRGIFSYSAYILAWISEVLSLISVIFGLYWLIITANQSWTKPNHGNLAATAFFLFLFSLISFISILMQLLNILPRLTLILKIVYHLSTILSLLVGFIALSLSTEGQTLAYYSNLQDYCWRTKNELSVCQDYPTEWSRHQFVNKRSSSAYSICAGIIAPWISIYFIRLIFQFIDSLTYHHPTSFKPEQNQSPINENHQEEPEDVPQDNLNP